MDIIEFAEKFMNVELKDWQKEHIRVLYDMRRDSNIRIVMPRHAGEHQVYIYMNQKELIPNGAANDCK